MGSRSTVKHGILAGAIWMGCAELVTMVWAAWHMQGQSTSFPLEGWIARLWGASLMGAEIGFIPAVIAAFIVAARERRASLVVIGILETAMSVVSIATIELMMPRS